MSILYLLRHGESEANANNNAYVSTRHNWEFGLTEKGCNQAVDAGHWIKEDMLSNLPPFEHTSDALDADETNRPIPAKLLSSPYLRAYNTAEIMGQHLNKKCKKNMLLAEWNTGEDDGVKEIFDFDNRPVERHFRERLGRLHYKPHRSESFLDMHVRAGVFVCQQSFFAFQPHTIAVTHMSFGIALHHFLLETVSTDHEEKWDNAEVRKYERHADRFEYLGGFTP